MRRRQRVCVLTAYNSRMQAIAAFTVPRMHAFAQTQGYEVRAISAEDWQRQRGWIKIEAVLAALDDDFDFILWVDIDALIVRRDVDVRAAAVDGADLHMVWHAPRTSVLQGFDLEPQYNSGVMLIRVADWSRSFFRQVWDVGQIDHPWTDQATILHLLGYDNILLLGPERPEEPNRRRVAHLDPIWNAVPGIAMAPDPIIHHYAGIEDPMTRLRLMEVDARTLAFRETASPEVRRSFSWQLSLWRQDAVGLRPPSLGAFP